MAVPTPVIAPAVPLLFEATDREINVITMQEVRCGMANFNRRDLFKAVLFEAGANELHYVTRSFIVDKPALVFTNRLVPYPWEIMAGSPEEQGYICTFTEAFLRSDMRGVSLKDSVLYKVDGSPVYFLDEPQLRYLREAFARLRRDLDSDYLHEYELLRHQLAKLQGHLLKSFGNGR